MSERSRRDQLIETALDLFSRGGFQAVGIDRLLSEAGVAKMTLYKHFRSKDELILAVLRVRDERWRAWFTHAVESKATEPRGRLLAVFDALAEWFAEPDFRGCLFVNAVAELGGSDEAACALAIEHKRYVTGYLRGLAEAAGARDADALARAMALLVEGATVTAQICRLPSVAADAKRAAEVLLAEHLPAPPGRR